MRHWIVCFVISLTCFSGLTNVAFAQVSETPEAIEAQAKEIGYALRCVVCQNQSIEESDASLAEDMRRLVRVRLTAGDSPDDVINFMQERYGDYVLLKPPVQSNTYILWFLPFLLVGVVFLWFVLQSRKREAIEAEPLSADERLKLRALSLKEETDT